MSSEFESAVENVKKLTQRPSNDQLLELYALFKQATDGDVSGKRPGMLDIKGRAKFDAWTGKKGLSSDSAKEQYVQLVKDLESNQS